MSHFAVRKLQATLAIGDPAHDKSAKGSVDAPIVGLVHAINAQADLATTSSCSGRVAVYHPDEDAWLLSVHGPITPEQLKACGTFANGTPLLKAEPFLMHVLCRSLEAGQRLLAVALEAGFRESGLVVAKGVMLGIRTTSYAMQVPLTHAMLADDALVDFLTRQANARLAENARRVQAFERAFAAAFPAPRSALPLWPAITRVLDASPALERWGHAAAVVGGLVFVFGGFRGGALLADPVLLDGHSLDVHTVLGKCPSPRVGLAAAALAGSKVVLFGGRASPSQPVADWSVYSVPDNAWTDLGQCQGVPARWMHVAVAIDGHRVLVHGGRDLAGVFGDAVVVDVRTMTVEATRGEGPGPRFAHAAVRVGDAVVVHGGLVDLSGGETATRDEAHLLDVKTLVWTRRRVPGLGSRFAHTLCALSDADVLVLGGVGEAGSARIVNLECNGNDGREVPLRVGHVLPVRHTASVVPGVRVVVVGGGCNCFAFGSVLSPSFSLAPATELALFARVPKREAEAARARLEAAGVLDKKRRAQPHGDAMLVPVTTHDVDWAEIVEHLPEQQPESKRAAHEAHRGRFDVAFDRVGDVAIVANEAEAALVDWREFATHHGVSRVLLGGRVDAGDARRQPGARVLYPAGADSCWVRVQEHGVGFEVDLARCMYSRGNVNEKQRFAALCRPGETVVDLFAGIGYFTVPALVKSQAAVVHACEWNPHALEALRRNLRGNGVEHRCVVYPGDCRRAAQRIGAVAQRVSMGLLPQAWEYLDAALAVLCAAGGWLHVHGNAADEAAWVGELMGRLAKHVEGGGATAECAHVQRVKSFAPGVWHFVADVHVGPGANNIQRLIAPASERSAAEELARKAADVLECMPDNDERDAARRAICTMFT